MIVGIGCDIEEIFRFEKFLDKENYLKKIYTENEIEELNTFSNTRRKMEFLASRYAVKEAMSKALGVGISGHFSFRDVEVKKDKLGKPYIIYGDYKTHLTISHTKTTAVAFVILEREV